MIIMAKKYPVLLAALAAFGIGLGIGYLTLSPSRASVIGDNKASASPTPSGNPATDSAPARSTRSSRTRETPIPIRRDAEGNYLLPPAMAERLECNVINGTKVNAGDLGILGLDDAQIGKTQQLVDEVFQSFFDRQRAAMREFTNGSDELVWEIPGNPDAAKADKQRLTDGLQEIAGPKAGLVTERLIGQIESSSAQLGSRDYFLRIYNPIPGARGNWLAFENIVIHSGPNGERPTPGSSFMDYQKQWTFDSSGRYGGVIPPDTVLPLVQDKDWPRLLKTER